MTDRNQIQVTMCSLPCVCRNGKPLTFAYQKVEAIIYYLAYQKSASKTELSSLLWDDTDRAHALKNLRNALYSMRKHFGTDLVIPDDNGHLQLNPTFDWQYDLDCHTAAEDLPSGSFLPGFSVRNSEAFEQWLASTRAHILTLFLNEKKERVERATMTSSWKELERNAIEYLKEDIFDEQITVRLMQLYRRQHAYHKAANVYQKLYNALKSELGITPLKETADLYYSIMNEWNSSAIEDSSPQKALPMSRRKLLSQIQSLSQNSSFDLNNSTAILLEGGAGIGKTYLFNCYIQQLQQSSALVLASNCYRTEVSTALSAWQPIMLYLADYLEQEHIEIPRPIRSKLSNFFTVFSDGADVPLAAEDYFGIYNIRALMDAVIMLLAFTSRKVKMVLAFEDLHWMDQASLDLLQQTIHKLTHEGILVLCTSRPLQQKQQLIHSLIEDGLLHVFAIHPLSAEECGSLVRSIWTDIPEAIDQSTLYYETGGNPLLLIQLVNTIRDSRRMDIVNRGEYNILDARIEGLEQNALQVLDVISLFPDSVPYRLLEEIINKNPLDLLYICNDLKQRFILVEREERGEMFLSFSHHRIRDIIYERMPLLNLRVLHLRVAHILEKQYFPFDSRYLSQVIYHFSKGNDPLNALKYKILNLLSYISICFYTMDLDEPVGIGGKGSPAISADFLNDYPADENLLDYFHQLRGKLQELRRTTSQQDLLDDLEVRLLYAEGHFCIYRAAYEPGVKLLSELLQYPMVKRNQELLIRIHRQLAYYGIQTCQLDIFHEHLISGYAIAEELKSEIELAIYCRLMGVYGIMSNDHVLAVKSLERSHKLLEQNFKENVKYMGNIAWVQNYMGDVSRAKGDYIDAAQKYAHALELCQNDEAIGAATIRNNYAQTLFFQGKYSDAQQQFQIANRLYATYWALMGRSTTFAYLSLFSAYEGNEHEAVQLLTAAENFARILGHLGEISAVMAIKACLKKWLVVNSPAGELSLVLSETPEEYSNQATNVLEAVPSQYRLMGIEQLLQAEF